MSVVKIPTKFQFIILILMVVASLAAMRLHPIHRIAEERQRVDLETMIPQTFGEWKQDIESSGYIVNPTVEQNLKGIYSQTLSRNYINKNGSFIMLSIAYGEEQTDTKRLHYPEFCYPAQGYQITSSQSNVIHTPYGDIPVRHLLAVMGARSEPITYWSTVGDKVVMPGREAKIEQLKYGFKGLIPDGLLFRVSSINENKEAAYKDHQLFIREMLTEMTQAQRLRLAGLSSAVAITHQ